MSPTLAAKACASSLVMHLAVLVALGLYVLPLVARSAPDTVEVTSVDPFETLETQPGVEILPAAAPAAVAAQAASRPVGSGELAELAEAGELAAGSGGGGGGLPWPDQWTGLGDAVGESPAAAPGQQGEAAFFGIASRGDRVVFVVDNSLSMGKRARFARARQELIAAIEQLGPEQRFYVIFFSSGAYPLFHPQPASDLLPATEENKRAAIRWIEGVGLKSNTFALEAVRLAWSLRPDTIYLLTDGVFSDQTAEMLLDPGTSGPKVNTISFVGGRSGKVLEQIARRHLGSYLFVPPEPQPAP